MANVYPQPLKPRSELNFRHAIKSSIADIRQLIALTIALYLSKPTSELEYSQSQGGKISIRASVENNLLAYFQDQVDIYLDGELDRSELLEIINNNPLFKAQMEPLQVGLELFLKLCRVSFTDGSASNKERTGGIRHEKKLHFTTNLEIIRLAFRQPDNDEDNLKWVLFDWIISPEPQQESLTSSTLKKILTIFSEETQFRLRDEQGESIYFQQEGIYKVLLQSEAVYGQDAQENVGPLRILKSFVGDSLHPFLKGDNQSITSNKRFVLNPKKNTEELRQYLGLVSNYLDIIPKRTTIIEVQQPAEADFAPQIELLTKSISTPPPYNLILFGAPGTGKSSALKKRCADSQNRYRVTFHPDSDYNSFVGGYKPVSDKDGKILYDYVPQQFVKAYKAAWSDPTSRHYLIIEEINRGNCAQIFGDLFQSLDRDKNGFSEYDIDADADLANHLHDFFETNAVAAQRLGDKLAEIGCLSTAYGKIILPNNLYLYATMNTSDQSLFPMDSAFKRRWDWEYVPIDYTDKANLMIQVADNATYSWAEFIEVVNKRIYEATLSEDKQLGYWFVKSAKDGTIARHDFLSKVMFYLWYEVFKLEPEERNIFRVRQAGADQDKLFTFSDLFDLGKQETLLIAFMDELKIPNQSAI
jgi:hypothetical protein